MGPMEMHEETVSTGTGVAPVAATPVAAAPVMGTPVAATPYATAPVATAPVSGVTHRSVGMWPTGYPAIQAVWLITGILAIFLALDFVFRLLNANNEGFGSFIYSVGGALSAPFYGLFNSHPIADIVAIIVYAIVAWIVAKIIEVAAYGSRRNATTTTTVV